MATNGFLPLSDAALLNWLNNASSVLTASPATYGSNLEAAATFAAVVTAYADAYATANEVSTRTKVTVADKDSARKAAKEAARQMASVAYGQAGITAGQLTAIGLTVKDTTPSPVPVPTTIPNVTLMLTGPQTMRVLARDPASETSRAKPAGVRQIMVQVYESTGGTTPPSDLSQWPGATPYGRTTIDLYFAEMIETTDVWVSCYWMNSRNERGPSSEPMSLRLPGLGMSSASQVVSGDEELRLAA